MQVRRWGVPLVVLAVAAGLGAWRAGATRATRGDGSASAPPGTEPARSAPATTGPAPPADGGRLDRHARDELRRRILAAWAADAEDAARGSAIGEDEPAGAAVADRSAARDYGTGTELDRDYIQSVMREELFPLARDCYAKLLERAPDAGGKVTFSFTIAGDARLGGYVDEAAIDAGSADAIQDPEMLDCMRESMLSVSFAPPRGKGTVSVVYPIELAPGD